ncbi:hypothetical protein chiPu_0032561 [Chiloscyllium punctatum]|uniref:Uncharacterized protein n=1 Tax=Chiloscyllium punctatum TaxID=137246 RepID=A0A401U0S7_CHIPU|nr:hypothetical protein [Chiloscyllium punctatum]
MPAPPPSSQPELGPGPGADVDLFRAEPVVFKVIINFEIVHKISGEQLHVGLRDRRVTENGKPQSRNYGRWSSPEGLRRPERGGRGLSEAGARDRGLHRAERRLPAGRPRCPSSLPRTRSA